MGSATPVITVAVAVAASVVAGPEVGAAIVETMGVEGASAATINAVGAAAISGSTSAVNSAIQGGNVEDVLKAGATGAIAGAVGSEVGGAVGEATAPTPGETGDIGTFSTEGSKIASAGAGGATKAFTQAELSGQNLEQSLKSGAVGGVTGALTQAVLPSDASPTEKALTGSVIGQGVNAIINPQGQAQFSSTAPTSSTTTTTGQGQASPGSQALAGALNIGGGDISPPVTIGGGEGGKQNVWNTASLRTKDETGS